MEIGGLQKLTLIDFPGKLSCTVFLIGCNFRCPWCYSKELVLPEEIKKQQRIPEKDFFKFLKERKGLLEGVCLSVAGDESVVIRNNKTLKHLSIEKLWDDTKQINYRINPIPYEYQKINFECLTKDGFKKAKEIIRHKINELYKIIASPGNYNVKLTRGHSIFVLTKKGLEVKKVNEIKKRDFLLSANSGIINHSLHLKTIDIIGYLPEIFNFSKEWIITKTYIRNKFSNVKIKIPRKIPITKQFCEFLGYAVAEGSARYRYSEGKKKNLSGYQFSLGNELKLTKKILKLYRNVFKSNTGTIDKKTGLSGKTQYNVMVGNLLIVKFINNLIGEGFLNKHIPTIIFNTTSENKIVFLKALAEGDGHQRIREKKSQQEFSIKTSSSQLAADIVFLANSLGVFSWVEEIKGDKQREKSFRVALSSNDFEKIEIKKEIKTKYSFNTRVKGLPKILVDYALRGQKRINIERLKKWLDLSDISKEKKRVGIRFNFLTKDGEISEKTKRIQFLYNLVKNWDIKEVKSIKKIKLKSPKYVYDLVVPGNHSFVGGTGSLLLHNTGGETTIYRELPAFIKKIKKLEYSVKLDTNGSNPKMLKDLIDEKLIDYVAMDIKAPLGLKFQISKSKFQNNFKIQILKYKKKIEKSVEILKNSEIDFEFRTTVVPGVHTKKDFLEIAKWIGGPNVKYYLQNFRPEKTIDPEFEKIKPYPQEFLTEIQQAISPFFKICQVR